MYNKHNLKMLPVNKTVVFKTPVENDEDVLCRTGTIAEGSCFYHSVLQAMSKEYQSMNVRDKMKFVSKLRKKISSKISESDWEDISDGIIAKVSFQENVLKYFTDVYLYLVRDKIKHKNSKKILEIILKKQTRDDLLFITELVPLEELEQNILPLSYTESENENIYQSKEMIIKNSVNYLLNRPEFKYVDDNKSDHLIRILIDMFTVILDICKQVSYEEYIDSLKDTSTDVDSFTLSVLSDKFNRDIYFIDGNTRIPYNNASTTANLKGRKSIIVLWIGNNHYEIVGRLLPNNVVQREFKHDDKLIQKIYTFLVYPKRVPKLYPELEPFIAKSVREKKSPNPYKYAYCSGSDSDISSEHSEESESSHEENYNGYHRSSSNRRRNTRGDKSYQSSKYY
jgi:hypothetical protein